MVVSQPWDLFLAAHLHTQRGHLSVPFSLLHGSMGSVLCAQFSGPLGLL
jgi:hypothetical protein